MNEKIVYGKCCVSIFLQHAAENIKSSTNLLKKATVCATMVSKFSVHK